MSDSAKADVKKAFEDWSTTPEAALAKWDLVEKYDGLFAGAFIALPQCLFKDAAGLDKGKFKFPLKLWNQSVTKSEFF